MNKHFFFFHPNSSLFCELEFLSCQLLPELGLVIHLLLGIINWDQPSNVVGQTCSIIELKDALILNLISKVKPIKNGDW